tara:strand:- start:9513 stop:9716 length:204 start_codon:yes stop_codon:yes gene_type:complete
MAFKHNYKIVAIGTDNSETTVKHITCTPLFMEKELQQYEANKPSDVYCYIAQDLGVSTGGSNDSTSN